VEVVVVVEVCVCRGISREEVIGAVGDGCSYPPLVAVRVYVGQSKNVWGVFNASSIITTRETYLAMAAEADYLIGRVLQAAGG
jgi:hypothetical protein